jgi:hypothetical protein
MAARAHDDLPAEGIIFGFPDDIPYAVIQFPHIENTNVRFLVSFEELKEGWRASITLPYYVTKVKLLEVVPCIQYFRVSNMFLGGYVKHNRRRLPLRTCFKAI